MIINDCFSKYYNFRLNSSQNLHKYQKHIIGMKGYKALLTQCELHNHKEMLKLQQNKLSFDQLCKSLQQFDEKLGQNIENLANELDYVERNSMKLIQNISREVNILVNSEGLYRCGCGFVGIDGKMYITHLKDDHRSLKYVEGSTHFATLFGNIYKVNEKFIERESFPRKSQHRPETTKVKQKSSNKNQRVQQEKRTKVNMSRQPQVCQVEKIEFFCGQCQKEITNFREYNKHMKIHDYIIHPNSSHIVIRKGTKIQEPMSVKGKQNCKQRFHCQCNMTNNFSRQQFVAHVFKWHKGIAPRK